MTKLSVNINKIAVVRNSRGGNVPDLLAAALAIELNVEGNPIDSFCRLVDQVRPAQVTLVPDAPDALTSNAGWDTVRNSGFLTQMCSRFREQGIRVSIFVDPDCDMVRGRGAPPRARTQCRTRSQYREPRIFPMPHPLVRRGVDRPCADKRRALLGIGEYGRHISQMSFGTIVVNR